MAWHDLFKKKPDAGEQKETVKFLNNLTHVEWRLLGGNYICNARNPEKIDIHTTEPTAASVKHVLFNRIGKKIGKDADCFTPELHPKNKATFMIPYGIMRDYFRAVNPKRKWGKESGRLRVADTGPASLDSVEDQDSIHANLDGGMEVMEHLNADIACRHRVVALLQEMIPGNWQKDCNVSQHGNDSNLVLSYYLDQPNEDQQNLLSKLTFSNHPIETAHDKTGRVHIKVTRDNLESLAAIRDSWIDTTPTPSQAQGRL